MKELLASVLIGVTGCLAGCMADPPPAASSGAKEMRAAPTQADEPFAILTEKDCNRWADHFSTRLKDATERRVAECDAKAGGPIETDAQDLEVAGKEASRLHALIVDQCSQQAGAKYPKKDAACFVGSKKMEEWASCNFESAFFSDYATVAKNHKKLFDERCRRALQHRTGI
jgi:hypothetical protein